jgi:hypothetical protein
MIPAQRLQHSYPTRIALLSVNVRDRAVLELLIERLLTREFQIVDRDVADMALVDGDSAGGRAAADDWQREKPKAPLAVLTLRPQESTGGVAYVAKPIDIQTLIKTLRTLRSWSPEECSVTRPCGEAPQPKSPAQPAPLQFARPIVLAPRDAFRPAHLSHDDTSARMVSVEICMSDDPAICLSLDSRTQHEPFRPAAAIASNRISAAA